METIAVLSNQCPNGDVVHTSEKLAQWIELGKCGGNCRASSLVETAVMTIHNSGVSMISDIGSNKRCHALGHHDRRRVPISDRSRSGSGSTIAGDAVACAIGQRS